MLTFRTSDGLITSGKLFCMNWQRRSTTALQLLLYSVSGSSSVWTNVFNSLADKALRGLEVAETLLGGGYVSKSFANRALRGLEVAKALLGVECNVKAENVAPCG